MRSLLGFALATLWFAPVAAANPHDDRVHVTADSQFTGPWAGWIRIGGIMLAPSHGRERNWEIAVPENVPPTAFTSPEPVPPAGG